jgi:hypothetical protein
MYISLITFISKPLVTSFSGKLGLVLLGTFVIIYLLKENNSSM